MENLICFDHSLGSYNMYRIILENTKYKHLQINNN